VDTEVEMKEIYASNHMWTVFENSFLPDMKKVADQVSATVKTKSHRKLVNYVCDSLITVIDSFFGSPFSSTAAAAAAAVTASSASSSDVHHQQRPQASADDDSGTLTSAATESAVSIVNTNSTAVVHVSVHSLVFYNSVLSYLF